MLIAAAALGGCASFSFFSANHAAMEPHTVSTKAGTWRVYDRAAEGKILMQRQTGDPIAQGLTGGAHVNAAAPSPNDLEAAEAFLVQSGRTCKIKDGYLVIAPSWEFTYQCDEAVVTGGLQAQQPSK